MSVDKTEIDYTAVRCRHGADLSICGLCVEPVRCAIPYGHGPHTVDDGRLQAECPGNRDTAKDGAR